MIGERIKEARIAKNMTQDELAERVGYKSRSSINKIELGLQDVPRKKAMKFANVLKVSIDYLMEDEGTALTPVAKNIVPFQTIELPILGKIACGKPIFADEEKGRYVSAQGIDADFALEAQGDSMIGDHIYNGNVVFCKNQPQVENGQIAVVIINDEATLKHFYYYPDRGMVILRASNPQYDDLIYADEEMADIRIIGRAVATEIAL